VHQVRHSMDCPDRSLKDRLYLYPQPLNTVFRRARSLTIQTSVAFDSLMLMTFRAHVANLAPDWEAYYASLGYHGSPSVGGRV
jgi:hypothetical protein